VTRRDAVLRDDRGMSTVVSHVLSVAITTLLIISLVATATGFLEEQRRRAADRELETIANRLAAELASADRLARQADGVEVSSTLPDTVVGSTYNVALRHDSVVDGPDCGVFDTKTCLWVNVTRFDRSTIVAVHNETQLELERGSGGQFVIDAPAGSESPQVSRRTIEMSPRVGIGRSVGAGPRFGGGARLSQTPIPGFTFSPGVPTTNTPVQFDASESTDADGSIDTYEWDLDDDGTFEASGVTATHTFSSAGSHNVTLRVTDNAGLGASVTEELLVSGLAYQNDLQVHPGTTEGIEFSVRNHHGSAIHIERILIDPADGGLDYLDAGWQEEIEMVSGIDYEEVHNGISIREDGEIIVLADELSIAASGGQAEIFLREFGEPTAGEEFTIGLRYHVNGTVSSTVFTDTAS
jgi:hypothetical protein